MNIFELPFLCLCIFQIHPPPPMCMHTKPTNENILIFIESSTKNIVIPSTINPQLNTTAVLDIIISKDIPQKDILSVTVSSATAASELRLKYFFCTLLFNFIYIYIVYILFI